MKHHPLPSENHDDFADILKLADQYTPAEAKDNDASWATFQAKLTQKEIPIKTPYFLVTYRKIMSYAAVIALLILAGYLYLQPEKYPPLNTVVENTQTGEFREIALPDGTKVTLSPNSELCYEISSSLRKVTLKGHARFEVARNEKAPFTVDASKAIVTVLGTGFDVNAYPNSHVKVFVNHGKVKVETEKEEIILTKDQSVMTQGSQLISWDYKNNPLTIDQGRLQFENARLDFVLETLQHFAGIQLSIDAKNQEHKFSGTLNLKQSPEEIATLLSVAMQIPISSVK
jgi:ferric-dicitrate binding protein FerR (iron transport regulator)